MAIIDKKLNYLKHKITIKKKYIDKRVDLINKYARIYKIDCNELYCILLLEFINRGHWITRNTEKLMVTLFTDIAVKCDFSIGIAQIKISTAKNFYPDMDIKILAKNLLNDDFNIHICALIIKDYYVSPLKSNILLGLVKKYTTGNKNSEDNVSIIIYYKLMKWIIDESLH